MGLIESKSEFVACEQQKQFKSQSHSCSLINGLIIRLLETTLANPITNNSFAKSADTEETPQFCGVSQASALFATKKQHFNQKKWPCYHLKLIVDCPKSYKIEGSIRKE